MSDDTSDNNQGRAPKRTLSLSGRGDSGTVRQSFSHGRAKTVVVEKRKRRIVGPGEAKQEAEAPAAPAPVAAPRPEPRVARPSRPTQTSGGERHGVVLRDLTNAEQEARMQALRDAQQRDIEERALAEEQARIRAEEEARLAREKVEEEARLAREKAEEEARRKLEEEASARAATETAVAPRREEPVREKPAEETRAAPRAAAPARAGEDESLRRAPVKVPAPAKPAPRGEDRRRSKLTITSALDEDESRRGRSLAAMRRRQEKAKRGQNTGPREKISREVIIPETITIQELSNRMAERGVDVIRFLMKQGQMLKITDVIDADTAQLIAEEFNHTVKRVAESDVEDGLFRDDVDDENLMSRPPVVTIMGHVDHGKTSLLDAIRKTNVVSGEAGGITQHIGAYQVEYEGQKITFIDTPGHEAFTAMRSRGAKATDIVILVVAADDSVMPTTIEAINHTRAAGVPMIVAINKMDKPSANPEKVSTDLLRYEVVVESMGGDVLQVEVSALKRMNLDKLLEAVLLQSEVLELKANPDRVADGIVVEAQLDKGRGPVATVLVQRGTLRQGDILVAGGEWGRVRALVNDKGETIAEAGPSMPVEVLGFQGIPSAGDRFSVVENEQRAREIADYRQRQLRDQNAARIGTSRGSLEQMMSKLQTAGRKEVAVLVKGDVQGSVEAIAQALEKLGNDEVACRVIHAAPGGVTESDVTLATASEAPIIAFNVRPNKQAREAAQREGIEIRQYSIIYDLVDDIKAAMSGMLSPERRETFLGNAEILEVFNITKVGKVAGCRVTEGTVERGAGVRLIRNDVVIHEGTLKTLKRFKDEVKEVHSGMECGMAFERYDDMRSGDIIECFRVEEVARTL